MTLNQTMRTALAFFLVLNLINLSVEIWNTTIVFVEINEEEEVRVVEDVFSTDVWTEKYSMPNALCYHLGIQNAEGLHGSMQGIDYIEIDSPPPRMA